MVYKSEFPPTDPFVQGDAFGRLAHGLPPGDQLWPLHLQPAGEQIPASHVRSRVPPPRFLCIRKSCSVVLTRNSQSRARGGREEQGMSLAKKDTTYVWGFQIYTVKRELPAPEDRHYIADDLVLFIHSQVSWLGSLWYGAQCARLQPRMWWHFKAGTYRIPSAWQPGRRCNQ